MRKNQAVPENRRRFKVKEIAYHRNGVCGEGFHVVLFAAPEIGDAVGVLFPGEGQCAVFNVAMLTDGSIAFAMGNSWRGDHFEDNLRAAIRESEGGAK